jgi:hypothetical protein
MGIVLSSQANLHVAHNFNHATRVQEMISIDDVIESESKTRARAEQNRIGCTQCTTYFILILHELMIHD